MREKGTTFILNVLITGAPVQTNIKCWSAGCTLCTGWQFAAQGLRWGKKTIEQDGSLRTKRRWI